MEGSPSPQSFDSTHVHCLPQKVLHIRLQRHLTSTEGIPQVLTVAWAFTTKLP